MYGIWVLTGGTGPINAWVKSYDPEAYEGRGEAVFTRDSDQAMRFSSISEAAIYYRQQSRSLPFREDGKPNRPLTHFTVMLTKIIYNPVWEH